MITKMFSVYDTKTQTYGVPFFMVTVGAAVRAFTDLANDRQSMVSRHPTDYILFETGEFNDADAQVKSFLQPKNLGLASDYIEVVKKPVDQFEFPAVVNGMKADPSAVR